jgi:hypothetical protein
MPDATPLGGETPYSLTSARGGPSGFETDQQVKDLEFRQIDALPAEEPGIDGQGARSDHRQYGAEDCLYDGNPWIARMRGIPRESDPHLNDRCERSRQWGPQTDQEKYPGADSDDLQDDCREQRCFTQIGDPKID